tara:strand:+ start:1446 stop:1553 length:108 start_codon:yes stop_codon:yes gene_type:complete
MDNLEKLEAIKLQVKGKELLDYLDVLIDIEKEYLD